MFHGMLPDSKVIGTAGRVRHATHKVSGRRGGRRSKGFGSILATFALQAEKERNAKMKARKARAR